MRLTTGELNIKTYNFMKKEISIQTSLSNLGFRHRYHAFHPFDTAKLIQLFWKKMHKKSR